MVRIGDIVKMITVGKGIMEIVLLVIAVLTGVSKTSSSTLAGEIPFQIRLHEGQANTSSIGEMKGISGILGNLGQVNSTIIDIPDDPWDSLNQTGDTLLHDDKKEAITAGGSFQQSKLPKRENDSQVKSEEVGTNDRDRKSAFKSRVKAQNCDGFNEQSNYSQSQISNGLKNDSSSQLCVSQQQSSNGTVFAPATASQTNQDADYEQDKNIRSLKGHSLQQHSAALNGTLKSNESVAVKNESSAKVLHIGGLFDLTSLFQLSSAASVTAGHSELAAARLAIRHINEQSFIPGYQLHIYVNDTKCDPGVGADAFYDMMYKKEQLLMLIATSCSEVAKTLGEIVPLWNLIMVSHAATSPALSDREKYPSFYRLAAADSSHNPARKTFIEHWGWDTVATMIQDVESFALANNEMTTDFEAVNISLKATLSFRDYTEDLHAKMIDLKDSDARIIIGSFHEDAARHVFCEAYHMNLYGPRYVWMLLGSYPIRWWTFGTNSTNCTDAQLEEAVEGHFTVDSLTSIIGNGHSISGLTTDEFLEEYNKLNIQPPRSMYAGLAYDSVWAVALALKRTLKSASRRGWINPLENFTYKNGSRIFKSFMSHMDRLQFTGVSGPISFDGSDRRGVSVVEQNQGGRLVRIALFHPKNSSLDFSCIGCQPVIWQGGKEPVDKITKILREERIYDSAFFAVCIASLAGMAIALIFLAFNFYYRKLKYIKLSSPRLNDMAAVGCVFVYSSVVLLGLDDNIIPDINYRALCMGRAFLWVAGFSLAFGAMFAKTYRVHQIFRRANRGILRSKLLKDNQLLLLIGGLLILDSIVMSLWIVIDPMDRDIQNLSAHPSQDDPDLYYIPQLSRCQCVHLQKWMGSLYAYKGLLLLFGVYMAWETRHVQIPVLNDSQYIGMNIYNVVLSSVTVVVLSSVLTEKPTLSYCLISALIITSTTGMLGLLFFPKIYDICKNSGSPIVTTSGMTFEGNTRRFVVDERKEKYYRAEVENRFLKRKLTQLDQEILRLERLLQVPSDGYYKPSDEVVLLLPDSTGDNPKFIISRDNIPDSNIPSGSAAEDATKISETLLQTTPLNLSNRSLYLGDCTDDVFENNSNSDIREPEITSDMGHTDPDYEEMMSEMGPPGMLTLIFNNDHVKQSQQSLNQEIIPQSSCANANADTSCIDSSCVPLLSNTSVTRNLTAGVGSDTDDSYMANNISARHKQL